MNTVMNETMQEAIKQVFGDNASDLQANKYNPNLGSFEYNLNLLGTSIESLQKLGYKITAIFPKAPKEMQIHVAKIKVTQPN